MSEQGPAAVEDAAAELLVEVAEMAGELVEDQRQAERDVLVLEAGVGGEDCLVTHVRRGEHPDL
jgi:hypothetical protein